MREIILCFEMNQEIYFFLDSSFINIYVIHKKAAFCTIMNGCYGVLAVREKKSERATLLIIKMSSSLTMFFVTVGDSYICWVIKFSCVCWNSLGMNCVRLLAELFIHSYMAKFIQNLHHMYMRSPGIML
jgi:hypothetical protein